MGDLNFDASQVTPHKAFDPLPADWYRMRIIKAELKHSDKAGQMLSLSHEIDEQAHPEHKGRKVFSNLCINHPNTEPREIARRTLSALAHSIGVLQLANVADLLGKVVQVKLRPVPAKDGFDAKNEVSGYRPLSGEDAAPVGAAPVGAASSSSAPAARPSNGKPGWRK